MLKLVYFIEIKYTYKINISSIQERYSSLVYKMNTELERRIYNQILHSLQNLHNCHIQNFCIHKEQGCKICRFLRQLWLCHHRQCCQLLLVQRRKRHLDRLQQRFQHLQICKIKVLAKNKLNKLLYSRCIKRKISLKVPN